MSAHAAGPATRYRNACAGDAENVCVLALGVWVATYAPSGLRDALSAYVLAELTADAYRLQIACPDKGVVLAEREGHLVGFAVTHRTSLCPCDASLTVELKTLYVHPGMQSQGIGAGLLKCVMALEQTGGAESLWLNAWEENRVALRFYRAAGFAQIGTSYFELGNERYPNAVLVRRLERVDVAN